MLAQPFHSTRGGFGAGWQTRVAVQMFSRQKIKFHVIFSMIGINTVHEPTRNIDMRKKPVADFVCEFLEELSELINK